MTGRAGAILAVLLAAMLWGSTGTLQALLPETRQPLAVGALRLLIGAAALWVLVLATGAGRAVARLPRLPVIWAGLAIGAYNLLFFTAVARAGVGLGTAIAIGSAPIWVALWDGITGAGWPRGARALGTGLAIAGAAILVASGAEPGAAPLGMVLAAGAGAAYAAYSLATGRAAGGGGGVPAPPPAALAAATFTLAALLALPVLALVPMGWAAAPGALWAVWPGLLALGVLATGLSYALYTWGLGRIGAGLAVTLALAEPLTAWVLAVLVVGEPVTAPRLVGAALLLAGLAVVSLPRRRAGASDTAGAGG